MAPSALAAFARLRDGKEPIDPDPDLAIPEGFLYQLTGERPTAAAARAMDAYFVVAAEHSFNASTFTARVITSTQSDMASAVCGAIGALKGPLHGGAPSEVVSQLHEIGSVDRAEKWIDDALDRGERLMGFGHRVYRAYDPRAAALREVAEGMGNSAEWLKLAVAVEDIALRKLAERHPDRPLFTNVEFYTAAVMQGIGLPANLYPSIFALRAARRLDGPRPGAGGQQPPHPPGRALHRPRRAVAARSRGRRLNFGRSGAFLQARAERPGDQHLGRAGATLVLDRVAVADARVAAREVRVDQAVARRRQLDRAGDGRIVERLAFEAVLHVDRLERPRMAVALLARRARRCRRSRSGASCGRWR